MTVIVQQPTDINGNPQPMVYDQDTGKVIVDSNGFIVSGGQRLVNIPSKADYVSTPKTQTAGIQEAINYAMNNPVGFDNPTVYSPPLHYWMPKIIILPGAYYVYESMNIDIPTITKDGNTYYLANFDVSGMPGSDMNTYIYAMFNGGYLFDINPTNINYMDFFMSYMQPAFPSGSSYVPDGWLKITNGSFFNATIALREVNTSNSGWGSNDVDIELTNRIALIHTKLDNPKLLMANDIYMEGGWIYNQSSPNAYLESIFIRLFPGFLIGPIIIGSSTYQTQHIEINSTINSLSSSDSLLQLTNNVQSIYIRGILGNDIASVVGLASGVSSATISYFKAIIDLNGGTGITGPFSITSYLASGVTVPAPTTPSVPASGTAQQNTNPYAVKVYVNGGALTEIQITINGTSYTVYSNSTASAVYEGFTLPAGANITLTYTTAPTWEWVPE